MRHLLDPLDFLTGEDKPAAAPAGGFAPYAMPLASVISNLATAGVQAYTTHEQSEASRRQAKLQQTAQEGDKGLRDYALDMRKKADEARAKAEQYRQATAGKGMPFGMAYKNLDETAKTIEAAAVAAEERAGLRTPAPSPAAFASAMQAQSPPHSFFKRNATVLIGAGAIATAGGILFLFLRRRRR